MFTSITTREQFNRFMVKARRQVRDNENYIKPEEWGAACEFAGIDYYNYTDGDCMWSDLCRAWEVKRTYTMEDAEREIKQAIALGEGGIYSFINDLMRGGDITDDEAFFLTCKYVNGVPTF